MLTSPHHPRGTDAIPFGQTRRQGPDYRANGRVQCVVLLPSARCTFHGPRGDTVGDLGHLLVEAQSGK